MLAVDPGRTYVGIKGKILPLCLKGRFYAIIAFRLKGKILRQSPGFVPLTGRFYARKVGKYGPSCT